MIVAETPLGSIPEQEVVDEHLVGRCGRPLIVSYDLQNYHWCEQQLQNEKVSKPTC